MELSKRLQAVADLLSEGMRVADIGCDHGFLSIYLVESGKSPACIALDVNKGPLERAREDIDRQRLSTYIETRLSNGACGLRFTETEKNRRLEVEAAVLAGMGGKLMIRLVEESLDKFCAMQEFILQPQSEIAQVRSFLRQKGFGITAEDMVLEEGKFYPIMKVEAGKGRPCPESAGERERQELYDCFGEHLLTQKHPVLRQFLEREKALYEGILEELGRQNTIKAMHRRQEVEERIRKTVQGLEWFKDEM